MFFPRLRRRAKWMFAFLAAAFALSVVFFGVGTGISGGNPWDAIQSFLQQRSAGEGADVAALRDRIAKNPADAEAQLELARALSGQGKTDEAIAALERYTTLEPQDASALKLLAGLYGVDASRARDRAVVAQTEEQRRLLGQFLAGGAESPLAQEIAQDPISEALAADANERFQVAYAEAQRAYRQQASVYQKLILLEPDNPDLLIQLGQASQFAGETDDAIAAYEQYLEIAPDSYLAPQIEERLEQLKQEASALEQLGQGN